MRNSFEPRLQRTWIAAGTAVVGIGTQVYNGIKQKNEAKKLASQNQYHPMGIPREELENQQIAKNQALQGLPSQQYNMAMQNIQRQQQTALAGGQDRRAGLGLIGQTQQNTDDATGRLDVENANARLQNQRSLYGVNNQVAAYKTQDWQNNEENRQRNYNYSQQLLGASNENITGAIDSGLAAITGMAGNGLFSGWKPLRNASGANPLNTKVDRSNNTTPNVQGGALNPLNLSFT